MIQGRVIRILDRRTVMLNVGEDHGVERGMRFGLYTPTEEVIDPETNETLGVYRTRKAVVEAQAVYPRFTVARPPSRTVRTQFGQQLGSLMSTYERVEEELDVAPGSIQPMPTGDQVAVGDVAQQLPTQTTQPPPKVAPPPASTEAPNEGES